MAAPKVKSTASKHDAKMKSIILKTRLFIENLNLTNFIEDFLNFFVVPKSPNVKF